MMNMKSKTSHRCLHPQPLRMHCKSCALVTSSGHMTGSGRGVEIDRKECVIRMNDAPTRGYQRDVGQRTSLRVVAHSSLQRVLRNRLELLNSSQNTFFIFWGPGNYMRQDGKGLVYNNLRLLKQMMPKLRVYVISSLKMLHLMSSLRRKQGKIGEDGNVSLACLIALSLLICTTCCKLL